MKKITFYANGVWNTINMEHIFSMCSMNRMDDNRLFIILSSGKEIIFNLRDNKVLTAIELVFAEDYKKLDLVVGQEYAIIKDNGVIMMATCQVIKTFNVEGFKKVIC